MAREKVMCDKTEVVLGPYTHSEFLQPLLVRSQAVPVRFRLRAIAVSKADESSHGTGCFDNMSDNAREVVLPVRWMHWGLW